MSVPSLPVSLVPDKLRTSVHRVACPQGCILLRALTFRRPISLTQSCLALASIISNILGGEEKEKEFLN